MVGCQEGRAGDEGLFTAIVCAGGAAVGAYDVGLDFKLRTQNIIVLSKNDGDCELLEKLVYQNGWELWGKTRVPFGRASGLQ